MRKLIERLQMEWAFFQHDKHLRREKRLTWIVWKLPKSIVYWAVVRAAVQSTDSYPGDVTAHHMLESIGY